VRTTQDREGRSLHLVASGNAIAVFSGYVIDDMNRDNAFKLTNGEAIFSSPKAVDAQPAACPTSSGA